MYKHIVKSIGAAIRPFNDPAYLRWRLFHAPHLRRFRNLHRGEGCFIMGNGPSLNRMDLSRLEGCCIFGTNKIFLLQEREGLRLSYYVAVNPLVIAQSARQIESMTVPAFLAFHEARGRIRPRTHIRFIATGGPYTFQQNLLGPIHQGYTVTFTALQIAYYMGFSEVFLIGVDHRYRVSEGRPNEERVLAGDDVNHFDPGYFRDAAWHVPDLAASELSYHMARYFFEREGRGVYDATVDGALTVFPKVSFEEALTRSRDGKGR